MPLINFKLNEGTGRNRLIVKMMPHIFSINAITYLEMSVRLMFRVQ